jgi:ComF family protein
MSDVRRSLFDLIFPRKCTGCDKSWLHEDEACWCSDCRGAIRWIRSPLCTVCGRPFPKSPSSSDHLCGECLASTFHFDYARSAAVHEGIIRDCIHALKFGGRLHHVPSLAQILVEAMEVEARMLEGAIIPVPLHTRRLRQRGFNQAALLARELGDRLNRPVRFDVLVRRQWTEPQTRLNREQRLHNVKNAFEVASPSLVKGGKVLLVDDVYTTGTTLTECARVLKRAGAEEVHAVTVTRSVPELNMLHRLEGESTADSAPTHGRFD